MLFFIIALLSFFILPIISFNAGISGDEEKHYMQAEKVYNYFVSDGKDTLALSDQKFKLNYYGQSFDLFTYVVIKKLHIEKVYEARHVMNGFIGATAILCSGLLARILIGNIAGIFTMLLLFFSPGYLGHSMNNPLDIPFALGYVFTLLQLVRFLKRLPVVNYRIALLISLGIAFTISIRIGGLVLIPYIFMFSGLYLLFSVMPWKNFSIPWIKLASKGLLVLSGISILAYFLSILTWPYALQNPLENPFKAMKMMENISVALRVMFDGKIIWSDNLPATYIPKSILLSIPLLVIAGFLAPIAFIRKNKNGFWVFFLLFVVTFPVAYIIYKESNVYGAWRHLLFIYPPMVVMAGMGMQSVLEISKNKFFRGGIILFFTAIMISPASHIIRNYPFQYIYFNEIAGGVKKAYKKYETDYYMVSLKPGTDWIKSNILKKEQADASRPLRIISNAPSDIMNYYFREYKDVVKLPYTRYYDRGIHDWDYAIFFCNYIDPFQITQNIWPPKNTIHSVLIDGVNICAIVKRENRDDYKGYQLMNNAIKNLSRNELDESILLMENAISIDKYNEITYLNLAQAYILREEFDTARKKLSELLSFYPNYEKALNLIGYSYLNEGEIKMDDKKIERAISIFNEVIRINHKFAGAYHNLGLAFLIQGDEDTAFSYFQKSIDNNPNSKESYFMMANILDKRGDPEQARNVREYAKRL
jgi:tetratricopeptide (TPR) repeat protein